MSYRKQWLRVSLGMLLAGEIQAQVTLDGTVGPAGALPGPNYAITADLGRQVGGNLFHSFGQFSIYSGESATFSGPNSVNNIIGRVTGGQVSTIDGTLRSTIPGASLWLLNPAGVLFGENASLDVPGSVHISTADYLRLSDGGRFDARTPGNSVLTVAPVEAFGFLGDRPGSITINGSFLQVPEGQTLSLIGGDITLTNATVYAPAGRLNVAAVGSAGEVAPTETDLTMQGFSQLGTLTIERDPTAPIVTVDMGEPFGEVPLGDLDTSGVGGGAIFIRGRNWLSQGGMVFSDTYGAQAGRDVDIQITGSMQFGSTQLTAVTYAQGDAGSITINAGNLLVDGQGSGDFTGIASSAQPGSTGAVGEINLTVAETLSLLNGSIISVSTFAQGDAGSVTISADNVLIDRQGSEYVTGIVSNASSYSTGGNGGDINLTVAETLAIFNGGEIGTSTFAQGNAGSVTISAGNILIDGQGSEYATGINSQAANSTGYGGDINLTVTNTLTLLDGGQISASTWDGGRAGNITITAGNIFADYSTINSGAGPGSTGAGGTVNLIVANSLTLLNGSQIGAGTLGTGKGGDLIVTAGGSIDIAGIDADGYSSGLFVSAMDDGMAGNLTVTTPHLTLADGSIIKATSQKTTGGNLFINADHLKMFNGSISSTAFGDVPRSDGGNVTINSTNIVALNGSTVTARANQGQGGNITVNADVFLNDAADVNDVLNASSEVFGNDGTVELNAPTTDISGNLVTLNTRYLDATSQLNPRCGGADPETRSHFTVQGRGALPADPGDALSVKASRCYTTIDSVPQTAPPVPLQTTMAGFGDR